MIPTSALALLGLTACATSGAQDLSTLESLSSTDAGSDPESSSRVGSFGDGGGACDDSSPDAVGCSCTPGAAPRACYPGPASQAGVGACTRGTQACQTRGEGEGASGVWAACEGAGQPTTCAAAGASCGTISDGCGGQLTCGNACPQCIAGSQTFATPGSTTFTVPGYQTLTVQVWGGGGGGQAYGETGHPAAGGSSSFDGTVIAGGGASGDTRTGGAASGGTNDTTGGSGGSGCGYPAVCGAAAGGSSPQGGAGGSGVKGLDACGGGDGPDGHTPGGGGGGDWSCQGEWQIGQGWGGAGGGGGGGAYASTTFAPGQLQVGSTVAVVVGAGGQGSEGVETSGNPGTGKNPGYYTGGSGADGQVTIAWTCP